MAESRWAIEYDREAADAFKLNNPHTTVFCDNCNVLLRVSAGGTRRRRGVPQAMCTERRVSGFGLLGRKDWERRVID